MTGSLERPAPDAAPLSSAQDVRPLLTVVRGEPTAEQLAALIAVVSARASTHLDAEPTAAPSLWGAPVLRTALLPGLGAWRASGLLH